MLSGAFTLYAVFSRVYGYIDSVLLYELAGDTAVGIYQIPFKIINALQFLPMAFTASLYPAFSLYWVSNRGQLGVTFERAMTYLIIISLPISIGTIAAADKIILLFSSGFSDAILPLKISIAAVFFIFLGYPIGSLLNACDRQKALTINMFAVLLLSIVLNVLLIPRYGVTGASITVLISNFATVVLGMLFVPKITAYNFKNIAFLFVKALTAAILMSLIVVLLKQKVHIAITILSSALSYALFLIAVKAISIKRYIRSARNFL